MATIDDLTAWPWDDDIVGPEIEERLLDDAQRCPASRTPLGVNVYAYEAVNDLLRDRRAECRLDLLALAQGIVEGPLHDLYTADMLAMNLWVPETRAWLVTLRFGTCG